MSARLPRGRIIVGDAATELAALPEGQVDCLVTSPPYFQLRQYASPDQLGTEESITDWVATLLGVFHEVARVLTPTGTLWLNLGDSYALHPRQGAPRKGLLLGPERLLLALSQDGWLVRNKVIWHKRSATPTSASDRLRCSWEAIYLLTRGSSYFFDLDAIREPHRSRARPQPGALARDGARGPNAAGASGLAALKALGQPGHPLGKNPGDVWALPASRFRSNHPAVFPDALAVRALQAGCPERRCQRCRKPYARPVRRSPDGNHAVRGQLAPTCACSRGSEAGVVLDPFIGSGTTAVAAERLGRDWLGIELNPAYVRLAEARVQSSRQQATRREGVQRCDSGPSEYAA